MNRITGHDVVMALKRLGRTVRVGEIAQEIGTSDTRAIATAARKPARDGRIRVSYRKPFGAGALYRFVRMKVKP